MTKITFFRKNGNFWGFREEGHTGFGEEGDDILCSALSAMTMLILNTLEASYGCSVDYVIDDETADITIKCLSALPKHSDDENKQFACEGLFRGYFLQINDLCDEYYEFLDVDVLDE